MRRHGYLKVWFILCINHAPSRLQFAQRVTIGLGADGCGLSVHAAKAVSDFVLC